MEKFILQGHSTGHFSGSKMFRIYLPPAKHFEPPTTDPYLLPPAHAMKELSLDEMADQKVKLISQAVDSKSRFKQHQHFNNKVLSEVYSRHSFPIAQGTAVPPLDEAAQIRGGKDHHSVFIHRTEFKHENDNCVEKIPIISGVDAYIGNEPVKSGKSVDVKFKIKRLCKFETHGPASLLKNMSIIYTCNNHQCIINCPCTICTDTKDSCKNICREIPCKDCTSQCSEHHLVGLSRTFDPAKHQCTLVTDNLNKYRYGTPFSNIPLNCKVCSSDVLEHDVLHHVFHLRCKFCRQEARPFDIMESSSMESYKSASTSVKNRDARTCSFCYKLLTDNYRRKNHERIIHGREEGKFKCNQCEKSYTNDSALRYHMDKHNEPSKLSCMECGKQYLSKEGLTIHNKIVHQLDSEPQFECDECGKKFTVARSLYRHKRTTHGDISGLNIAFFENPDDALKHTCKQCEKQFLRVDHLNRHVLSSHTLKESIPCSQCDKTFTRKENLKRHQKLKHP